MKYPTHPTYVDPATDRVVMSADTLQVSPASFVDDNPPVTFDSDRPSLLNLSGGIYQDMLYAYMPPPVAQFNGDASLLVIDRTKVLGLKLNENHALGDTVFPLPVTSALANQENVKPQVPPPASKGKKRKAKRVDEEEEEENVPAPSTKRKKTVLKSQKENKKSASKASGSSDGNEKPFKCPQCKHTSKRRSNMPAHIRSHDTNRIKEFVCSKCNKGFTRKNDRDRHEANLHQWSALFVSLKLKNKKKSL